MAEYKDRSKALPTQQERRVATEVSGRRQPASGAFTHAKGDVVSAELLIDAKTTDKSFSLTQDVLMKLVTQARKRGKIPMLQVDVRSMPESSQRWAVIPYDYFLQLKGE